MCLSKVTVIYVFAVIATGNIASTAPTGLDESDYSVAPDEPGTVSAPHQKISPPTPKFPRNTLHLNMGIFPEKPAEERYMYRMLPSHSLSGQYKKSTSPTPIESRNWVEIGQVF
jgi:hypothetical protein